MILKFKALKYDNTEDKCDFDVSLTGLAPGGFNPAKQNSDGSQSFEIPPASTFPVPVTVRAKPKDSRFWEMIGTFVVENASGKIKRLKSRPESFHFNHGLIPTGSSLVLVYAYLSIFRDVTDEAFAKLLAVPDDRKDIISAFESNFPPTSWGTPALKDFSAVTPAILVGNDVKVSKMTYAPQTTERVLERKGSETPKWIVASWPNSLTRSAAAGRTPFVVFFTHGPSQNLADGWHYLLNYPDGWDYLYRMIWQYLNFSYDPMDIVHKGHYSRGLLPQIASSKRKLVLVMPLANANLPDNEFGNFVDASVVARTLKEIEAFFFREAGINYVPNDAIGHCALGAFSNGCVYAARFLGNSKNQSDPFYKDTLREAFAFDPPGHVDWVNPALAWAKTGSPDPAKVVRFYRRVESSCEQAHKLLFGKGMAVPKAPYVTGYPAFPNRTVACLPEKSWFSCSGATFWGDIHQLICATMLLDVLRRSTGFIA